MDDVIRLPGSVPAQRPGSAPRPGSAEPTPYLVLDPAVAVAQLQRLRAALPGVDLHYAVKCNPHPALLRALADAGARFEIASAAELDLLVALGVVRADVLFSNPVKPVAHIAHARAHGVRRFAFDSADEVAKLSAAAPGCDAILRIDVSNAASVVPLAGKFGAAPDDAAGLLLQARDAGLRPAGLTFHVGSQALDAAAWARATALCGGILRTLLRHRVVLRLLDIGGGFPIRYDEEVPEPEAIGAALRPALEALPYPLAVAAEPGRFLAGPAGEMVATVIGRARRRGEDWLHLDVGAFGGLMEALETDRALRYPLRCTHEHATPPATVRVHVTGPTCDSEDTVLVDAPVCAALRTGDTVVLGAAGAYTTAYASTFNGFPAPQTLVVGGPPGPWWARRRSQRQTAAT